MGEDCRICQFYSNELRSIHSDFNSEAINFIGLFPNRYSSEDGIAAFKSKYDIPFILKREYYQTKTKKFGVSITPEVIIYDEKNKKLLYKGRIDDSYVRVGRRKRHVSSHDLREALTSIKEQKLIKNPETIAIGCFITFVD